MVETFTSPPSWEYKGWPSRPPETSLDQVVDERLNIFDDGFLLPLATISAESLTHNLETMARFCRENDVDLAPHAKTTMSPEIIERQLDLGAWAITAATVSQARTFRRFGVGRILIAHQVVDPAAVRWIADELAADADVEIICLVDSVSAVDVMQQALVKTSVKRPIGVLVELGVRGGRSGCRSVDEAVAVARAVAAAPELRLVGIEGYEGVIEGVNGNHAAIDNFLSDIAAVAKAVDELGLFADADEVVLTAGGSLFPDRAVAVLREADPLSKATRVVIRSGCYVTHDSIMYQRGGPFGTRPPMDTYPALSPAMVVWSYVVSRPEPDLAILGFGKRDASFDIDLPRPLVIRRGKETGRSDPLEPGQLEIFSLNDQHAFARVQPGVEIAVGDIVGCGISHPCTTFDKWRALPLVDANFDVVGAIRTFF